MYYIEMPIIGT